ncbi:DUF1360 domain-containing protein [Conexibacter sp. SYSU D00693]|uniref:DUF1360 domain-containing protein n=1 Tax=Conexibacter sp. SYSU D00693 TaxID=2812560 RepID=UPI00196B93D3|nr:DUF1360 domain-containing protein [Conexibacter sp. SYSU D00693]
MSPDVQDRVAEATGADGYAPPGEDRPLAAYTGLSATFFAALGGGLLAARAAGREVPDRPSAADVVLVGLATQKLTRLIAKDKVTSFVRAPFTRFQESTGHGEVDEAARGTGFQKAMGELLVCPYCLAQWVAGGFAVGLVAAPRTTRLLAGMWTAQTIADFTQLAYKAVEDRA